jgi:O-antigen/teichoic acid export membrane protein
MSLYTRDRTRRSLIDTVAFRAVSQVATILGYIVMVRGMSKHDFGTFNLLYSFIPVLSTVASLGLEQTLRRYQPEYLREGNQAAAAWLVRVVASARFGTNVILLAALLLTWNYFAPFFKLDPYRAEFAFFCLLVLLFFQSRILQLALAGRMLHRYSVGSMAVLAIVKLVAYVVLTWQESLTVRNAILAETLGFGIAYLSMLGAYRRHCLAGRESGYSPDPEEKRRLFRYGLFNNFNDAGTLMLTTRTDNFFIAAILDPVSVGVYSFYSRLNIMGLHLLPVKLFENVVQPVFFAVSREEADRKLPPYFSLLLNLNLMLQWPMFAYATAYHAEIVQVVFGGKFVEQSWLLPLMVAFAMVNVVATPVTLVAQYEERPLILLTSKVFGIYNAVALILLLPIAGVYGAAIASGTAQAMKNGFIWWKVRQRARWTNGGVALLSGILVWGGVVLVCRAFGVLFHGVPIVNLGIGAVVVALGALLHVRGPAISAGDRTILSTVLRGREAKWLRRLGILRTSGRKPSSAESS